MSDPVVLGVFLGVSLFGAFEVGFHAGKKSLSNRLMRKIAQLVKENATITVVPDEAE